ncbi:putative glycosyltransferase protein [Halobacteriovorax marinus SJ]|uniref:Glycosyltransferase protein n=1 Tax=Halobacteriovorax marinus (strain ATCC BAA-682 / DSM 15412 / SJ) TaxID=862908 RepID=E1X3V2_HALMS|nr:glycosyltransferase [Halobacteriovorax marinus]CBW25292.1 putative glycosyltransferase protein [Halobacteriovorax marinus SJ]
MAIVSIIIPTYNHAHLISRCLTSLISQSFSDWEAIVVNNFSSDNTIDVVNSFQDPRIKIINFNNNGVIGASRNKGLEEASGEYISFLDSDDFWKKDKLEICVLKLIDGADIVYHPMEIYTSKGESGEVKYSRKLSRPVFNDFMLHGNEIINSSVVIKSSIIKKAGGLSNSKKLFGVEDYDLWIRVSRVTEKFEFIDMCLGYYWVGEGNNSNPSPEYIERYKFLYSQYSAFVPSELTSKHKAFVQYEITRQAHKCGELQSSRVYFEIFYRLDTLKQKLKAFYFGLKLSLGF